MFRDLYARELDVLYQLAEEYGDAYPQLAPMLGRDADPAVSRLLQSVAFTFARLQQRLDDDLPEVIHPILDAVCPSFLRPLPSATIVELTPEAAMKEPTTVAAGALFGSRPVDGAPCVFRSTVACDLQPWALRRVQVDAERTRVTLRLELLDGAQLEVAARGALRLFFAMPIAAALATRSALLRTTAAVTVRSVETKAQVTIDGERPLRSVLPPLAPERGADLLRLRAYFTWPEHFAFVELPDVSRVGSLGDATRTLDVTLSLDAPLPDGLAPSASTVRLHCVPAVNVHRAAATTLPLDAGACVVRFARDEIELFDLERVSLVRANLATVPVARWDRFLPPPLDETGRLPILCRLHRATSVTGPRVDVALSFVSMDGRPLPRDVTSVEIDAWVTDGARASQLAPGDVCVPMTGSPPLASFRDVVPVTRSVPPPLEGDRAWQVLQWLRATLPQAIDPSYLGAVLALANLPAWARWPDAKPDADRFRPLLAVRRSRGELPTREEVRLGAAIEARVDVERFAGPGDVDLFAELLGPLLASTVRATEWIQVTVTDGEGERRFEHPRLFGTREGF